MAPACCWYAAEMQTRKFWDLTHWYKSHTLTLHWQDNLQAVCCSFISFDFTSTYNTQPTSVQLHVHHYSSAAGTECNRTLTAPVVHWDLLSWRAHAVVYGSVEALCNGSFVKSLQYKQSWISWCSYRYTWRRDWQSTRMDGPGKEEGRRVDGNNGQKDTWMDDTKHSQRVWFF